MPLLRNAARAIIEPQKLRDYLLNPDNPNNGGKWRVFFALGYRPEFWEILDTDLRSQHLTQEAEFSRATPHGERYKIAGILREPRGSANIESVWQFDVGSEVARADFRVLRVMYKEHDGVILVGDIEESRLAPRGPGQVSVVDGNRAVPKGTHGAIVDLYNQTEFLVEFFDSAGKTIGFADVKSTEVRRATKADYAATAGSKSR